jgi:hypothetical protein
MRAETDRLIRADSPQAGIMRAETDVSCLGVSCRCHVIACCLGCQRHGVVSSRAAQTRRIAAGVDIIS